jgi:hypothetical protein
VRGGSARLGGMRDNEFTKILGWPGYRVCRHEIDEAAKTLRLWVRRKRGEPQTDLFGIPEMLSFSQADYGSSS